MTAVAKHEIEEEPEEIRGLVSGATSPQVAALFRAAENSSSFVSYSQPSPGVNQTPPPWSTHAQDLANGDLDPDVPVVPPSSDPADYFWESPLIVVPTILPGRDALAAAGGVLFPYWAVNAAQAMVDGTTKIVVDFHRPNPPEGVAGMSRVTQGSPRSMRALAEAILTVCNAVEGGDW